MILGLVGLMTAAPVMADSVNGSIETRQDFDSVSSFCRDRLQILKNAYRLAELESASGNHARSAAILEAGLLDAEARILPRYSQTLTSKAIKRGIVLLANLKSTAESRQKLRTINNFLFNYFLFVEDVSNRLDIPYFQPGSVFGRIANNNEQFERLFVNFAQEQVVMVLKTMSTQVNDGRSSIVYPIGSPTLLLTALQVTTAAMANDLSDSIFATRHACRIAQLETASNNIGTYLATRDAYADEFVAVQELVGSVNRALGLGDCGRVEVRYEQTAKTTDAIGRSITLQSGTTQQVRLNGGRYIKKLIISAEGIRNEALFEVVVNGDIKGTIHVPGRDPSYFVTVEAYTDSIELVSRNGNASISRILVVAE